MRTLYLIDISSFIFRAFYAIRGLKNRNGTPTNAVFGVASMLGRLFDEAKPEHLIAVFDSKEPSFRKKLYADYKANRAEPPEDLVPQFPLVDELVGKLKLHRLRQAGFEADDLIASATRAWLAQGEDREVVIVTGDKDLLQLVDGRARVWDTMASKTYRSAEVKEKLGVEPAQVRDYLALVGDSSDNIPGVEGIGPKGAADLLAQHGTLEQVLDAAKKGAIPGKKGEQLRAGGESALLSRELATLRDDIEVDVSESATAFRFEVDAECARFLQELDFHTLAKKWATPATGEIAGIEVGAKDDRSRFRAITTEQAFAEVLRALDRAPELAVDLETTSLNPRAAKIVGIALGWTDDFGVYVPIGHEGLGVQQLPEARVIEALRPVLEDPRRKKIGQNLKYDMSVLAENGIRMQGLGADTMVASYVLDPEGRHNLDTLARRYLDYEVLTYAEVCGKGKNEIPFSQVPIDRAARYSAEDAWVAWMLWRKLKPELEREALVEVFATIDLPLVPVLSEMERAGIRVDEKYLEGLGREFGAEMRRIEERVQSFSKDPVNLNSPKQLQKLLFDELKLPTRSRTKTGFSTDADVLEALGPLHEVPRLLLEYREISKLKGTYVDPIPRMVDPITGRIHASFHQAVAATGRLSSSDPNLQNIPVRTERGQRIRRAFVASPGTALVGADYSQIELRILADMSGDPELIRSFRADEDVHRRTASEIFGVEPESVDDRQRGVAKAINFGLMYGKTPFGLSQELGIPRREAQEIIDRYFARYRGVKSYFEKVITEARERGWVVTRFGRKRKLPDLVSRNPAMRAMAERMAMNTPIQGTAADLMKLAMIQLSEALAAGGFRSRMIVQVHDEILLECPLEEAGEVEKLASRVMESAASFAVPLRVNSARGANWMEI